MSTDRDVTDAPDDDELSESILRGETKVISEADVRVETSAAGGAAKLVVKDDRSLVRIGVDLTEADTRELIDELQRHV